MTLRIPQPQEAGGCGSPVFKVWDQGRYVMSSSPVQLKTRLVGQRSTLNLSRAETSSRWCGVVVRRRGASSGLLITIWIFFRSGHLIFRMADCEVGETTRYCNPPVAFPSRWLRSAAEGEDSDERKQQ
ncbi:hypothetical protein TNCV_978971 [Trichonephila clavipes]|nr:hypothetical protein TNCV_978971 [Trichonephila clavipes]